MLLNYDFLSFFLWFYCFVPTVMWIIFHWNLTTRLPAAVRPFCYYMHFSIAALTSVSRDLWKFQCFNKFPSSFVFGFSCPKERKREGEGRERRTYHPKWSNYPPTYPLRRGNWFSEWWKKKNYKKNQGPKVERIFSFMVCKVRLRVWVGRRDRNNIRVRVRCIDESRKRWRRRNTYPKLGSPAHVC